LDPIEAIERWSGGYKIVFHGRVPPQGKVRLLLGGSERYSMDITGGYGRHPQRNLAQLLDLMEEGNFWEGKVPVRVAVYLNGKMQIETLSAAREIQCPLKPLYEIGIEEIGAVEGLRYTGKAGGSGGGAFLTSPIRGKYFFYYNLMLETHWKRRGFDCTTFVGSALGLPNGTNQKSSEMLADALNAQSCNIEHKHAQAIDKFFTEHQSGSYLMWSSEHVVIVKDSFVHEFTNRVSHDKGYQRTEISEWLGLDETSDKKLKAHSKQQWTVRKLTL
jgi:hypothetical protein